MTFVKNRWQKWTILKGRRLLLQEIAELKAKNDALIKKNIQLRDRLSQEYLRRKDNDRARKR